MEELINEKVIYFNENELDEEFKMYVIARAQLNPIYQCVQGGHALIEYSMTFPEQTYEWHNKYLIYLNTYSLDSLMETLDRNGINYAAFTEPDMGNSITAIACYSDGEFFEDLKLIRA